MEHQPTSPTGIFQGASPKLAFLFGLVTGVAATAVVGMLIILPRVYAAKSSNTGTAYTNTSAPTNTNTADAPSYNNVKAVTSDDYVRGDKNAKLTLIEYSDYECPYCKRFHSTMQQVATDYNGQVRWILRHFPLSFHQNAQKEAEAGLCVAKLGGSDKFWDFTDKIFERTSSNGTGFALDALPALAKEVGVNQAKFKDCLDSGEMAARVSAESTDGQNAGATGTPTTFLVDQNGKTITAIPGALPYDQVKTTIDQALASL